MESARSELELDGCGVHDDGVASVDRSNEIRIRERTRTSAVDLDVKLEQACVDGANVEDRGAPQANAPTVR
jgi:hypothetical protein